MENEPRWARLIDTLYEEESSRFDRNQSSGGPLPEDHDLIDKTGLSREGLNKSIHYLWDAGLLKTTGGSDKFVLTKKGFDVAHERNIRRWTEKQQTNRAEEQNDVNRAIGILTLGIVFFSFTDSSFYVISETATPEWGLIVGLTGNFLVFILLLWLLSRTGLLSISNSSEELSS